jgi:hypothetical protein
MRILTVGFEEEYVKHLEAELDKYFICIVDNARDMYDATNFTDFRHYELVIIVDEGVRFSLERYVNEVKKKKSETKIMILTSNYRQQAGFSLWAWMMSSISIVSIRILLQRECWQT